MSIFKNKKIEEKSTKEIIEEIHDTFYTEVDRLLADAKIMNSIETDRQPLLDKYDRLKKLGFSHCREAQEAQKEINRLEELKRENISKEVLVGAINYFSQKYPQYKFITEESVKKICKKYNLVYGPVNKYIGEIPTKNLEDMEKFSVKEEDKAYLVNTISRWGTNQDEFINHKEYLEKTKPEKKSYYPGFRSLGSIYMEYEFMSTNFHRTYKEAPLEIAAPIKDFKMEGMEIKDFKISKIEIPDPVVLQPVMYNNVKYYLIVTAWGEEGSDELVVNQKMN